MSIYPPAATAQGLYEVSSTPKAKLGTRAQFDQTEGVVEAIYCKWNNAASVAAGFCVAQALDVDGGAWAIDTAPLAATNAVANNAYGVMCASAQATSDGAAYVWVAYRGPVTNAQLSASANSNVVSLVSIHSAAANLGVVGSAVATANEIGRNRIVGQLGATASTISRAATAGASGHYVQLFWR